MRRESSFVLVLITLSLLSLAVCDHYVYEEVVQQPQEQHVRNQELVQVDTASTRKRTRKYSFSWNAKGVKEYTDDAEDSGWNGKGAERKNSLGVDIINGNKNLGSKKTGYISQDAYTGPQGHYYIGRRRRRVGAGFGRRRRTKQAWDAEEWWANGKFKTYAMWRKHSVLKAAFKKLGKRKGKSRALSRLLHPRYKWSYGRSVRTPVYPPGFHPAKRASRVCHSDCMRLSTFKRYCAKCKVRVPIPPKGRKVPKLESKKHKRAVGDYCCGCPKFKCLPGADKWRYPVRRAAYASASPKAMKVWKALKRSVKGASYGSASSMVSSEARYGVHFAYKNSVPTKRTQNTNQPVRRQSKPATPALKPMPSPVNPNPFAKKGQAEANSTLLAWKQEEKNAEEAAAVSAKEWN